MPFALPPPQSSPVNGEEVRQTIPSEYVAPAIASIQMIGMAGAKLA